MFQTYTRSDGVVIEFLSVYDTRQNTAKYALKLVDSFFIDKKEFQNIDVKKADEDLRIKAIHGKQMLMNNSIELGYPSDLI